MTNIYLHNKLITILRLFPETDDQTFNIKQEFFEKLNDEKTRVVYCHKFSPGRSHMKENGLQSNRTIWTINKRNYRISIEKVIEIFTRR